MKKLCTVLLAVLMLFSVVLGVVACNDKTETYTAEQIEAAIKLMDMRYGESAQPVKTEEDFTVTNKIRAGAIIFNLKWEVENGGTVVTLGEPDADGIITVKVTETKTEVNYTLKVTLVGSNGEPVQDENGKTYSKSYPHTVPVSTQKKAILEQYNESIIKNPEAGKPYKWALFYQPDGKVYYFTGKNDRGDYKWQTSTKVSEAADVYVEVVEGGYHVYFMNGTAKKYIEPCAQSSGGASIRSADTPTYLIKMNEDHVLYADVAEDLSVYMGGYNTYNTIRGRSMDFFTTAPTKQFPARLVSAVDYQYEEFVKPTTEAEIIKAAKNLSDGEILGGSDVTFTLTGKVKSVGDYNEQYGNFDFVIVVADTEFTVFRFKAASNTVVAVDQTVTVTGNITKYGEKLEITNGKLEGGETPEPAPSGELKTNFYKAVAATVEADKEYTLALYQSSKGKVFYFNGKKSGNFIDTTENFAEAVKVKLVAVEGGYRISFVADGKTQYIDAYEWSSGKVGVQLTETPTAVFTYNAELKTLVAKVINVDYYLGSYKIDATKDFNTISASKTDYITGDNASKIDVTQFPVRLLNLTEDLNSGSTTPDPKPEVPTVETEHKGTEEDPYSVADALKVLAALKDGEYTSPVYTKGYVKSIDKYNASYINNIVLVDEAGSETSILVYSCNYTDAVKVVATGDTIVVKGALINYINYDKSVVKEISNVKDGDTTIHPYPTFVARTAGQGSIAIDTSNEHVTITVTNGQTTGANDSTFTFTVVAASGYEITGVTVNGIKVTAVDGVYTGTIRGETVIAASTKVEGAAEPTLKATAVCTEATRTEASTTKQVYVSNGCTITNEGTVNPKYYGRFYQKSSLKIEYTGMMKIVINCAFADKTGGLEGYTAAGATITVEGKVVTIVFATATDVFTIDSLAAQMRTESIEIYTL